jgi:protein-histidine pros-kinase
MAESKGIQLEVRASEKGITVRTDQRALRQILLNLANNAVKFTEKGSVLIEISQQGLDSSDAVLFRVTDTGIGIRAEDQIKLFQAFSRVEDPSHHRNFEGTGLGLHLSAKLAELLFGRIAFESEFGKGSSFCLTLSRR